MTPYFRFPFFSNRRRYPTYQVKKDEQEERVEKEEPRSSSNNDSSDSSEVRSIDIMGISLKLDDLLIIGLLLCLYNEGMKDKGLFITLVLLLIT